MADTTTTTNTTAPTPVQSTDINGALVALFGAITAREGVDAGAIQAAAAQHAQDQATIAQDASDKTSEDAALATAQADAVSPAVLSSIDAATNALNSGTPLPAFPGAPLPAASATAGATTGATTGASAGS